MSEDPGLPVVLVRPALELAWVVARAGAASSPPVAAPGPLRPLLRFARLPGRTLGVVEGVVTGDEGFRARVADVATEENVGRAGWLWLVRPEGWEDELASLVDQARSSETEVGDRRAERSARQRLAGVEAALRRSDAELATARSALGRVADEVADLRRERRRADDTAEAARSAQAEAEGRSAALGRQVDELTAALAVAGERSRAATAAAGSARTEIDELQAGLAIARSDLEAARRRCREVEERAATSRSTVGASVLDAATAARALGDALAAAAAAVGVLAPASASGGFPAPGIGRHRIPEPVRSAPVPVEPRPSADAGRGGARRTPIPLPAATFDDSPEAAQHLVRTPGVLVVVDGYNVSISAWPDLDIAVQRQRLVPALDELSARTGAAVQVVFDGAEDPTGAAPRMARRPVRVSFSPAGVEADEVIIELVEDLPAGQPVVVATSDRRVADEVRRRGANVITTPQLLGLLRRIAPGA